MADRKEIRTGVDTLVDLVEKKGKINFKQAAKVLGVPVSSIEDWAKFLEEEDILVVDYKFSNPVLIKKALSKEQQKAQLTEFNKSRDIFNKRLESARNYFYELDEKINYATKLFKNMDGVLESKVDFIYGEIKQLKKAEKQKEALDNDLIESKKRLLKRMHEIEKHLEEEHKTFNTSFEDAKKTLKKDGAVLLETTNFLEKIKSEEGYLKKRLKEVHEMSDKMQKELDNRSKAFLNAETRVREIKKKHEVLRKELQTEHDEMQSILEENEKKEKHIKEIQNSIYKRLEEGERKLDKKEKEIKDLPNHFKKILDHKGKIKELITLITNEEVNLKDEIKLLDKKAKHLQKSLGKPEFEKEMKLIAEKLDDVTDKRNFFNKQIKKLVELFEWQD